MELIVRIEIAYLFLPALVFLYIIYLWYRKNIMRENIVIK